MYKDITEYRGVNMDDIHFLKYVINASKVTATETTNDKKLPDFETRVLLHGFFESYETRFLNNIKNKGGVCCFTFKGYDFQCFRTACKSKKKKCKENWTFVLKNETKILHSLYNMHGISKGNKIFQTIKK